MKSDKADKTNKKNFKWLTLIITAVITLTALGLTLFLIFGTSSVSTFKVNDSMLHISGFYSETIKLNGAVIELKDTPLNITKRTNGFSSGGVRKGSYTVAGISGSVYLNMYDTEAPYKYISIFSSTGKYYFINFAVEAKTLSLYEEIIEHMSGAQNAINQ